MNISIKQIINNITKNLYYVIFCLAILILGIMLGVLYKVDLGGDALYNNVINFNVIILNFDTNSLVLLFRRLFFNLLLFAIIFACCLNKFTVYLSLLILFYRGLVLGIIAKFFFNIYGISGIFTFIFLIVPQNLCVSFGIIYSSIVSCVYLKNCDKFNISNVFFNVLIGFIASCIGAIYEFLMIFIIIRPLNFYF